MSSRESSACSKATSACLHVQATPCRCFHTSPASIEFRTGRAFAHGTLIVNDNGEQRSNALVEDDVFVGARTGPTASPVFAQRPESGTSASSTKRDRP